ncbi:MAG TPA: peptidoglycan DD-metalloendopeptidase family protein [Gaiellaceae bacterium]|nr:peptidoglycan DD-metalloendopeptidase family protein [Gaiellaceae bacterium]
MTRRLAIGVVAVLAAAAPAFADIVEKKQSIDTRIAELQERVQSAKEREAALQHEIDSVSGEIRGLEQQVGVVSERLAPLERELELRELKLNRLNALFQVQTERLHFLQAQYRTAVARFNRRIVAVYESNSPDELSFLLAARSFSDLVDGLDYVRLIVRRDREIVHEVGAAKRDVTAARAETRAARANVRRQAEIVAVRVREARSLRDQLVASRGKLEEARQQKKVSLDELTAAERADAEEIDALRQASADLAAKIRAAQAHSTVQRVSGAGFVWPVSAPITSSFGWRWGRMHEGVDLGAAYGSPIAAAAAGVVIYAGWEGGYGNLVVIDHGGGLATAYGHQSRIAVSVGESVAQGQIIGYVGSTGHSTGPHLHFEVRVDGQAVDPLGYL